MFQDSAPVDMPTPLLFVLAFGVAAAVSVFAGAVTTPKHAVLGLVVVGAACAAVTRRGSGPRAALVVVPVFWLCFDGFVEHRFGVLGWNGTTDAYRLAALLAAALLPFLGRALHGVRTARRRFRRASLEWFEPEMPERTHPSAWN
ncbi:hypothetical protein [Streptacidiphilus rugosus]|uniref:hypothetical protein n=1 Tax=Streptacidiphilus rugosus TaxID=405783 RepID=UPI000563AF89|nr:hypothetical protein [Streptacidiphilus rugosus]